ncbi:choice-of-anchor D domain-containing protein [Martelella sp. HB161492]|uniref:DUF7507 domain-containing protein n=1 Tax=Martelella sp. HB161492 TaxID=2720726 RepID=UPI0015915A7B|nr:choice-of-anchor D domain-containing protein [Martelella sp. HB161492]
MNFLTALVCAFLSAIFGHRAGRLPMRRRRHLSRQLACFSLAFTLVLPLFAASVPAIVPRAEAAEIPTLSCKSEGWVLNTASLSSTSALQSGVDPHWEITAVNGPSVSGAQYPAGSVTFQPAIILANKYLQQQYPYAKGFTNANWISYSDSGQQTSDFHDYYLRYRFNLDPDTDPSSLKLEMDYYADDSIAAVFVNRLSQNVSSPISEGRYDYTNNGWEAGHQAQGKLQGNFQTGLNEIVIQVKSALDATGFLAQFTASSVCNPAAPPKIKLSGVAKVNGQENATFKPGDTVTFNYTVSNPGPTPVSSVRLNYDNPPAFGSRTNVQPMPDLAIGAAETPFAVSYTATQADFSSGEITNTALAAAIGNGISVETDPVTLRVQASQIGSFDANKDVYNTTANTKDYYREGDVLHYTITVKNTGSVALTNTRPDDQTLAQKGITLRIESGSEPLQPGAQIVYGADYKATAADVDAGSLTNIATVSPRDANGNDLERLTREAKINAQAPSYDFTLQKDAKVEDGTADGRYSAVGQTVSYAFKVSNTGDTVIRDVNIADTDLPGLVWKEGQTIASIEPGQSATIQATYKVTQVDLDRGQIHNTASATANKRDGNPVDGGSRTDDATVYAAQKGDLSIVKSVKVDGQDVRTYKLGSKIVYSFKVTNNGNVAVDNIAVRDDDLKSGITIQPGSLTSLQPGGSTDFYTSTYVATQADMDAGQITNANAVASGTTKASGQPVTSPPSNAVTISSAQAPGLTLSKDGSVANSRGDNKYAAGETISYTFNLENTGNVTLSNITITDNVLPAGTVYSPASVATLAPGNTARISASYKATQDDVDNGRIVNTATAHSTLPGGGKGPDSAPSTKTLDAYQNAVLTLAKTGSVQNSDDGYYTYVGQTVRYALTVENTGNIKLTNVTIDDPNLSWEQGNTVATLSPGQKTSLYGSYKLKAEDLKRGEFTNTANAQATANLSTKALTVVHANEAHYTVEANLLPALKTTKTATIKGRPDNSYQAVGDEIDYTIKVENTGNVAMTNITLKDDLLTGLGIVPTPDDPSKVASLAPGETVTFTAAYNVTQSDLDNGSVTNVASASGTPPGDLPPVDSPPDTVTSDAGAQPGFTVVKSGTIDDGGVRYDSTDDTITYHFVVKNTGNVTLKDISVTDKSLPLTVTPDKALTDLGPGAEAGFTAHYKVTVDDLDRGSITNIATGHANRLDGTPTGDVDSNQVVLEASQNASLGLKKDGAVINRVSDIYVVGDTIEYTFTVTNTGNVTMNSISIIDDLLDGKATINPSVYAELKPGDSTPFTAQYKATQADVDNGAIINHATLTAKLRDGSDLADPPKAEHRINADARPGLVIHKTGVLNDDNDNKIGDKGETITYTFEVENTGNTTINDVRIVDAMLDGAGVKTSPETLDSLKQGEKQVFTAIYPLSDSDAKGSSVTNEAHASGTRPGDGSPFDSDPDTVTVSWVAPSTLKVEKTGTYNDVDQNAYASLGDTITYEVTITNDGGQTAEDVLPVDQGVSFDGHEATGTLAAFDPSGPVTLAPGASQHYTVTYTLSEADIEAAAGKDEAVINQATATGRAGKQQLPANIATAKVSLPRTEPADISVVKTAGIRTVHRGQKAPFTILATNNSDRQVTGFSVVDTIPSGFRYVTGTATINGQSVTPVVAGRQVRFENLTLKPKEQLTIFLQMMALSTVSPGTYTNVAIADDGKGNSISGRGEASVVIAVDPVFDCSDIIGRVFDDKNGDGYPDDGEPGLPGVRVATVNGLLVTTDPYGRFHIACADLPDNTIGSNFILKLDERTLPQGYHMTTENPRVMRLTAGKMIKFNFGAEAGTVIGLEITDDAFLKDEAALSPDWDQGLDQLIAVLKQQPAPLRINYRVKHNGALQKMRADALSEAIQARWKKADGKKPLDIEVRTETGG